MPVFTSSDHLAPKSILRHRPIDPTANLVEPPRVPRASRTQTQKPTATLTVPINGKFQVPWRQHLLMVGIGFGMAFTVLLVCVGQFLLGWLGTTMDDLQYGRPRTFQIDAEVGHHDSLGHPSHFIALNLKGQIEVIEFPGGDATQAKIYLGPHLYGSNAPLVPVTLQFVDIRHDHSPEMIVQVQGEWLTFSNTQGVFHAPSMNSSQEKPSEASYAVTSPYTSLSLRVGSAVT